MRLITKKVYRAFPELDEYDDELCRRFVECAQGTSVNYVIGWLFLVVVSILTFAAVSAMLYLILPAGSLVAQDIAVYVSVLFAALVAPIAALLAKDIRLRRRVRYVLRERGTCDSCGYSLIGLVLDRNNIVVCPECKQETEVDPALAQLVRNGEQQTIASYRSTTLPPRSKLIAAIVGRIVKIGIIACIVLALGIAITLSVREVIVRRMAASAREVKFPVEELKEYAQRIPAPPNVNNITPATGKFWELLRLRGKYFVDTHPSNYSYNASLLQPYDASESEIGINGSGCRTLLLTDVFHAKAINDSELNGAFSDLYAILAMQDKSPTIENGYEESEIFTNLWYSGIIRTSSVLLQYLCVLIQEKRHDEYITGLRSAMQLAHAMRLCLNETALFMSDDFEINMHLTVRAVLTNHNELNDEVLEELARIYVQELPRLPDDYPWAAIKQRSNYDTAQWYIDPAIF